MACNDQLRSRHRAATQLYERRGVSDRAKAFILHTENNTSVLLFYCTYFLHCAPRPSNSTRSPLTFRAGSRDWKPATRPPSKSALFPHLLM
jgi:hypothetical protein